MENQETAEKEFSLGVSALAVEDTLTALACLERAIRLRDHPGWHSYLGYCVAKERGQFRKGLELCLSSLEAEPDHPGHFLNLGRVHLLSGDKVEAMRVLREGMTRGRSPELVQLLDSLGTRNSPLIPMLSRKNPLNRYLGMLLSRLGLR
jgi:tetratricopeptide (TPR) repeat protein